MGDLGPWKLLLAFAPFLAWGLWDLWALRRDRLRAEARAASEAARPSPPPGRS